MKPKYLNIFKELYDHNALYDHLMKLDWLEATKARKELFFYKDDSLNYTYGKPPFDRTYSSKKFTGPVKDLLHILNIHFGTDYDICFLNRYDDKKSQLGWHADDSPEMDPEHPIAVVSLGAEREIWWKQKDIKGNIPDDQKILLEDGSLFVMPAGFQADHLHRIPKCDSECGTRISLTFRKYKDLNKCPYCESIDIEDESEYTNNGILGPGFKSRKIKEMYSCNDCGIYFKKIK